MWVSKTRRPRSFCLLLALVAACGVFCGTSCAEFEFVGSKQPRIVVPEKPQVNQIRGTDLAPLAPDVRLKLRANIKTWILYMRKWEETARVYNEGVDRRNADVRRRLQE